ncbi:DUF3592 domain-containing protein [Promicromonospora sp. CA-289599]|uniref:DUF3592 domain-containing protein n=1 Tax=Promicromonospora sp. CA-289599 TaxID=3240014 RepID=UPI003D91DB62
MERQIAAGEEESRDSRWATARARMAAQSARTRAALRSATAGALLAMICGLLAFAAFPAYLTFGYFQERAVLESHGVRVEASVLRLDVGRGPDSLTARPIEPPRFETTLDRWPRGVDVGETIDVVYDPRDPGVAIAVDEPLVNFDTILVALFDLFALALLLLVPLAIGELLRRAWTRLRDGRPGNEHLLSEQPPLEIRPARRRPQVLARLETPQIVFFLILAPVASAVLFGLFAAESVNDARALQDTGARARGVVERSDWSAGGCWLDVRFQLPDGTEATSSISPWDDVYFEGDVVELVYEPGQPGNAQALGDSGWQAETRFVVGLSVALTATASVAVLAAAVALVQRARRPATDHATDHAAGPPAG